MRMAGSPFLGLTIVLVLAVACLAETVFLTEPSTPVRAGPGLRNQPFSIVLWGESFPLIRHVGSWSRISLPNDVDGFVWSEWITTYEIVHEKDVGSRGREVHFTIPRYLANPTLEAMCNHIHEGEREKSPKLHSLVIEGYLASEYPKGKSVCRAHVSLDGASDGVSEELVLELPEEQPVTSRDMEIHDWLGEAFRSKNRGGQAIFACDSLWIEAGEHFDLSPEMVRFVYDRVRWSLAGQRSIPE